MSTELQQQLCKAFGGAHIGETVEDLAEAIDSKSNFPELAHLAPMVQAAKCVFMCHLMGFFSTYASNE